MKLDKTQTKDLKKKLTICKKVMGQSSLPILGAVKIQDNSITATDLETSIKIPFELDMEGVFDVRKLIECLDEPETVLDGRVNGHVLESFAVDEFPSIDFEKGNKLFKYTPEILTVSEFASKDKTRPALLGVYFGDDMVATDGYYMGLSPNKTGFKGLIPAKSARVLNLLGESSYTIKDNRAIFTGDVSLNILMIDGNFPDYKKLVPDAPARFIGDMINFILPKNDFVYIKTEPGGIVLTQKDEKDNVIFERRYITDCSENFESAFKVKLLKTVIKCFPDGLTWKQEDRFKPALFERRDFSAVLMPIRTA